MLKIVLSLFIFLSCVTFATREVTKASAACSIVKPRPANTVCGTAGSLKHPQRLGAPQQFDSFDECLALCSRHRVPPGTEAYPNYGCISFSYSETSNICTLYQASLTGTLGQGFMASSTSDTKFWSIKCFSCPAICPQPLDTNLIDNGDFEEPLLGPWLNVFAGSVQSPGLNSAKLFTCSKNDCEVSQMFDVCENNFYHIGLHYKIEGSNAAGNIASISVDGAYGDFTGNGEWQFLEMWFAAPRAKSNLLDVFFYAPAGVKGKYTYSLDTVSVHRISGEFSTKHGAPERVSNGGFETGRLAPWKAYHTKKTSFNVVNKGINSAHGLRFSGHAGGEGEPSGFGQTLSLAVGRVYLLRFTIQKLNNGAQFGYVSIGGYHPDLPATQIHNGTLEFKLPFRAHSQKVHLGFQLFFGDLLIDNISVKQFVEN